MKFFFDINQILTIYSIKKFKSNFAVTDKKKLTEKSNILCEALWSNPVHFLRLFIFVLTLRKKLNFKIVGLCLKNLSYLDQKLFTCIIDQKPYFIKNFHVSEKKTSFFKKKEFVFSSTIFKHIYSDFYCKLFKLPSTSFYSKQSNDLKIYIDQLTERYEKIIRENKINIAVLSQHNGIYLGALCYVLLKNKVKVYILNGVNKHITIRKMKELSYYFKCFDDFISQDEYDQISEEQKKIYSVRGEESIKSTIFFNESDFARLNIYGDKKPFFKDKKSFMNYFNFNSNEKVFTIMSNCYTDFPNCYKEVWYKDYYQFLKITLDLAEKTNFNWLLKPHPAEHEYGITTNQLLSSGIIKLPKNVKIWKSANNQDRLRYVDGIVTATGTSALESTCLGQLAICGEETVYSFLNFSRYATNKKEYENLIMNINKFEVKKEDIIKAKIFYYFYNTNIGLKLPSQAIGRKAYTQIKYFFKNHDLINREMHLIDQWIYSNYERFDVFKKIRDVN